MKKFVYLVLMIISSNIKIYTIEPNDGPDSLKLAITLIVRSHQNIPMNPINLASKKKDRTQSARKFAEMIHRGEFSDAVDAYTLKTRLLDDKHQQTFIDQVAQTTATYVKNIIDFPVIFTQKEFLTAYKHSQKMYDKRTHDLYYNIALRKTAQPQN